MHFDMHGMTMAYEEYGSGPAVLFVDGFSTVSDGWTTHIQPLVMAGYRVIVQRFCTADVAAAVSAECSLQVQGEAVVSLLNYLGIGRAAIVGRSSGDQVLQTLLQHYPQRVAAVVIADVLKRQGAGREGKKLKRLMPKRRTDSASQPEGGSDIVRNLLDFLNTLKKFRSRYPISLQVA